VGHFAVFKKYVPCEEMEINWHTRRLEEMKPLALHEMLALRQAVFIVEQYCPYPDADDQDLISWHLLGYAQEKLVAYTRLLPPGSSYENEISLGRVLTHESTRGKGLGKVLMQKAIAECRKLFGSLPIRISAQSYLHEFYRELGFVATGKNYLEDGIPHIEMLKKD
jgi:ElaA protein